MKRRNLFRSAALICGLCCFAFTFDNLEIRWLWADARPVAFILAITAIIFGVLWFKSSRNLKAEIQK